MNPLHFFKLKLLYVFVAVAIVSFSACDDDDEPAVVVTVDDAAELVAYSIAKRTYGAVHNLNYLAENIVNTLECNESNTTSRTVSDSSIDGEINVSYDITESYSKLCDSLETINYSFNALQELSSIRLDAEQAIDGDWTVIGFEDNASTVSYSGDYNRTGTWIYNLDKNHVDQVSFTSQLNSLMASLADGQITAGDANFELVGTSTVHADYSYQGSIVFYENNIAVISFQSGEQYELNLETGDITRIQ